MKRNKVPVGEKIKAMESSIAHWNTNLKLLKGIKPLRWFDVVEWHVAHCFGTDCAYCELMWIFEVDCEKCELGHTKRKGYCMPPWEDLADFIYTKDDLLQGKYTNSGWYSDRTYLKVPVSGVDRKQLIAYVLDIITYLKDALADLKKHIPSVARGVKK